MPACGRRHKHTQACGSTRICMSPCAKKVQSGASSHISHMLPCHSISQPMLKTLPSACMACRSLCLHILHTESIYQHTLVPSSICHHSACQHTLVNARACCHMVAHLNMICQVYWHMVTEASRCYNMVVYYTTFNHIPAYVSIRQHMLPQRALAYMLAHAVSPCSSTFGHIIQNAILFLRYAQQLPQDLTHFIGLFFHRASQGSVGCHTVSQGAFRTL